VEENLSGRSPPLDAGGSVSQTKNEIPNSSITPDTTKAHPASPDNGKYTVLFYYRHNRLSDAKIYVAAVLSAGFKSSSIATELT
jgi:hypothetical protein